MNEISRCIENCLECRRVCLQTLVYCLSRGGDHSISQHVRLLIGCAEICLTHADFMAMGSEHHPDIGRTCAKICAECAEECERFRDDEKMERCAEVCRRCAESCRETSDTPVHAHAGHGIEIEEPGRTPGSAEGE